MTRRLLAAVCLAAVAGGLAATPAAAQHENWLCVGGDNQRKPGYQQGICLGPGALRSE